MRRVLPGDRFAEWLPKFLPDSSSLTPQISPDPSDGKLAHLDGLKIQPRVDVSRYRAKSSRRPRAANGARFKERKRQPRPVSRL